MRCIYKAPCGQLMIEVDRGEVTKCHWIVKMIDGGDRADVLSDSYAENLVFEHDEKYCLLQKSDDNWLLEKVISQLKEYFAGTRYKFDLPLRIDGTPFRKKVWRVLREIPYGITITYSELAVRCGCSGGQRAVAQGCSANSFPIMIPCHRVLKSDGSLGGYTISSDAIGIGKGTTSQGLAIKRFLLEHERKWLKI